MNDEKTYLIYAGSYEQFRFCVRENNINPKKVVYVHRALDVFGRVPKHTVIIKFGTWYENRDDSAITAELQSGQKMQIA